MINDFDFLLPVEETKDFREVSKEFVLEAKKILDVKSVQGIESSKMFKQMTFCETANVPWEHVTFNIDTNMLTDVSGERVKEIKIPGFVEEIRTANYGVTALGANNCIGNCIENISIGKNVIVIGNETFSYYRKLKRVYFEEGSGLISLGVGAFSNCESLSALDLSRCEMLDVLPDYIVSNSAVKILKISNNIREISERAFNYSNIEKVSVGKQRYSFNEFFNTLRNNSFKAFWSGENSYVF